MTATLMAGCPRRTAAPSRRCRRGATGSGFRAIDPALPSDLGGVVAHEVAIGPIAFRHEPTGAVGEIAGHLHPKARVTRRGRSMERRWFSREGERARVPAVGASSRGPGIRRRAVLTKFPKTWLNGHVI